MLAVQYPFPLSPGVFARLKRKANLTVFLFFSFVGGWMVFQVGSLHFHPETFSCSEDYTHVSIEMVRIHHSHSYSIYYFQPNTSAEHFHDWHLPPLDLLFDVHDGEDAEDYSIPMQTFPKDIPELTSPKQPIFKNNEQRKLYSPPPLCGTPILFIPGHAGEYKQGKGFASTIYSMLEPEATEQKFDIFAVDFDWQLSAFHGTTLQKQGKYVTKAIEMILNSYQHLAISERPKSVILLGHSMGGIVARLAVKNFGKDIESKSFNSPKLSLVDSKYIEEVETIITFGAPHVTAAWPIDETTSRTYESLNRFYADHNKDYLRNLLIISLSGGFADTQVQGELSELPVELISHHRSFFTYTSSIPTVRSSVDHQMLCRCAPFLKTLSQALYDIKNTSSSTLREKLTIYKKYLEDPIPQYFGICHETLFDQQETFSTSENFWNPSKSSSMFLEQFQNTLYNTEEPLGGAVHAKDPETLQHRLQRCTLSTNHWRIVRSYDESIPMDLCWQITPERQRFFFLSSFASLPSGFFQLVKFTNSGIQHYSPDSMTIFSPHLNGSFIRLEGEKLLDFNFVYLNVSLLSWTHENDFLVANWMGYDDHYIIGASPKSSEYFESPILHFQFPWLSNKLQRIKAFAMATLDNSTYIDDLLFPPFFYQVTQTPNACETKFSDNTKGSEHGEVSHWLEFHQSEPLSSAPHLFLFSDPRATVKVSFAYKINFVQCFRSYSRFLMPVMLFFPLVTLGYMLLVWIRYGVFFGYYFGMANLVIKLFVPCWLLISVFALYWEEPIIPLELTSSAQLRDESLVALFDDELILHSLIPFPYWFVILAPICAVGWVVAWSSPLWLLATVLRKLFMCFLVQIKPIHELVNAEENVMFHTWPVVSILICMLCLYHPILALVLSSALLFLQIVMTKPPLEGKEFHTNYQICVFVLMYLCCVWKFGCLFTSVFQLSEMHSLDIECLLMLPIVQLGILSSVLMFPRSLGSQRTIETNIARFVKRFSEFSVIDFPTYIPSSITVLACAGFIIVFSWHYIYRAMYGVSMACTILDIIHLFDWYQRSSYKATKQM